MKTDMINNIINSEPILRVAIGTLQVYCDVYGIKMDEAVLISNQDIRRVVDEIGEETLCSLANYYNSYTISKEELDCIDYDYQLGDTLRNLCEVNHSITWKWFYMAYPIPMPTQAMPLFTNNMIPIPYDMFGEIVNIVFNSIDKDLKRKQSSAHSFDVKYHSFDIKYNEVYTTASVPPTSNTSTTYGSYADYDRFDSLQRNIGITRILSSKIKLCKALDLPILTSNEKDFELSVDELCLLPGPYLSHAAFLTRLYADRKSNSQIPELFSLFPCLEAL